MKRILGELWTHRREAERLEVLSRNGEIDQQNDRKALQALQDYVAQRRGKQSVTEMNPLDTWMA